MNKQEPLFFVQVPPERRLFVAQIDALFSTVTVGVCAAATAAAALVAILWGFDFVTAERGLTWAVYIGICAFSHIALCLAYRRACAATKRWRVWAFWFTAICFAEGLGWGWAQMGLVAVGRFDIKLIVLLVTLGVAAGSMQAFGSYLPASFAFFVPATSAYVVTSLLSGEPLQRWSSVLMLIFIAAIVVLGLKANRSFKQHVALRIRSEDLAVELQRQKEIAEQQKLIAERASLAKSTFLAAASHDLRQPVHALGLFVGALRGVAIAPEGVRLIDQIESSITAIDSLFSALLDISRLDAGIIEVNRRSFDLQPLLERICNDHSDDTRAKGISILRKHAKAVVDSDPVLVERILRNLVSNAVRYTDRGRVVIGCRRRGGAISVQVWDTGRGIPHDQQERVFQEYYQLGNPERDRAKGLGLGLAIVRRLTDLLDVRLTLRSTPGQGSCFDIVLPLAKSSEEHSTGKHEVLSGALVRALIVVVDDELAIREAMESLLVGWGYQVVTAGSGNEAIQRLATYPVRPDLIISDYRLRDGENGIFVIEQLRAEYNETIPAMLITGDTAPKRLSDARASGLMLLHKPVSNSKMRASIINLIAAGVDTELELNDP